MRQWRLVSPWPNAVDAAVLRKVTAALRAAMGLAANVTADPNFEYDAVDIALQRTASAVSVRIEEYAPCAPRASRDEALIRAIAWLRDTEGADRERGVGPLSLEPSPVNSQAWFLYSGAAALLTRWKRRRAGAV